MIIGISGKIGSGKDTVGLIIQYLTNPKGFGGIDLLKFIERYEGKNLDCDWEVKKFADKLKDIVCMLIGCTREQLENREFKEGELGEQWRIWYATSYKFKSDSNPTGRISSIFTTKEEVKLKIESFGSKVFEGYEIESEVLTPRKMLQILGTEGGRGLIHPNIWVNSLMADYKPKDKNLMAFNIVMEPKLADAHNKSLPNWLVTDTRFPNEADAIKEKGGILIRVNRGDGNTGDHPSETSLDNYNNWDYVLDNNASLTGLSKKVEDILKERNLL